MNAKHIALYKNQEIGKWVIFLQRKCGLLEMGSEEWSYPWSEEPILLQELQLNKLKILQILEQEMMKTKLRPWAQSNLDFSEHIHSVWVSI